MAASPALKSRVTIAKVGRLGSCLPHAVKSSNLVCAGSKSLRSLQPFHIQHVCRGLVMTDLWQYDRWMQMPTEAWVRGLEWVASQPSNTSTGASLSATPQSECTSHAKIYRLSAAYSLLYLDIRQGLCSYQPHARISICFAVRKSCLPQHSYCPCQHDAA